MKFSATLDAWSNTISRIVLIVFVVLLLFMIAGVVFSEEPLGPMLVLPAILLLIFGAAYLFRPLGYEIADNALNIERAILPPRYQLDQQWHYSTPHLADLGITLRLFAAAAFWGYFGIFYSFRIGIFTGYCTRFDHLVLLEHDNGQKIILSPDDIGGFINALARCGCRASV